MCLNLCMCSAPCSMHILSFGICSFMFRLWSCLRSNTPVSYPKLHVCALWLATWVYLYRSPKTRLADNISHPSTYCAVIESYISYHIIQTGQLQQRLKLQLAETESGPICGMKHQLQLHLCVFLIYPSWYSSCPPPLLPSHTLLLDLICH